MSEASSLMGFVVIVTLYLVIGCLAATGSICISQRIFRPKAEEIFFALFLIPIAGFYLAFTAYFEMGKAWQIEGAAVLVFSALGLVGTRVPWVLIVGYSLHGIWDMLHELQAHGAGSLFDQGELTVIPLAYGIFCMAFDFWMAAYFFTRRNAWVAAWQSEAH